MPDVADDHPWNVLIAVPEGKVNTIKVPAHMLKEEWADRDRDFVGLEIRMGKESPEWAKSIALRIIEAADNEIRRMREEAE